MHRKRTKLAARAHRAGDGGRATGVAATYELHDRLLVEPRAPPQGSRTHVPSSTTSQRVDRRARCEREGYAGVPFAELVPDADAPQQIEEQADRFADRDRARRSPATARGAAPARRQGVRRAGSTATTSTSRSTTRGSDACSSQPHARRREHVPRAVVEARVRRRLVLDPARRSSSERKASQRWHRDFNDRHLLKAFLYLVDVDEETGPFEYVAGSARGGPLRHHWPWRPLERELSAAGRARRSGFRPRRSRRSPRRRGRSSSATRAASTAAASRRRGRASWRR